MFFVKYVFVQSTSYPVWGTLPQTCLRQVGRVRLSAIRTGYGINKNWGWSEAPDTTDTNIHTIASMHVQPAPVWGNNVFLVYKTSQTDDLNKLSNQIYVTVNLVKQSLHMLSMHTAYGWFKSRHYKFALPFFYLFCTGIFRLCFSCGRDKKTKGVNGIKLKRPSENSLVHCTSSVSCLMVTAT